MTPLRRTWTKRVIDRLDLAHNGKLTGWLKTGQVEAMVALWAEKLAGLDAEAIKRGLASAERMDKPPTPAQFRSLCARPPAHEPYQALPLPAVSPEQAERNRAAMRAAMRAATSKATQRRCVYRIGYGRAEHDAAIHALHKQGLPLYIADMRAMSHHGWHEALEAAIRLEWMKLPGRRLVAPDRHPSRAALYLPGHQPPDWVLHSTDPAAVDQWIATAEAA